MADAETVARLSVFADVEAFYKDDHSGHIKSPELSTLLTVFRAMAGSHAEDLEATPGLDDVGRGVKLFCRLVQILAISHGYNPGLPPQHRS